MASSHPRSKGARAPRRPRRHHLDYQHVERTPLFFCRADGVKEEQERGCLTWFTFFYHFQGHRHTHSHKKEKKTSPGFMRMNGNALSFLGHGFRGATAQLFHRNKTAAVD